MIKFTVLKILLITCIVIGNTVFSYGMQSHSSEEIRTRFYQKDGFILSEPTLFTDERDYPGNDPDLKELSRTSMRDGLIYTSKNSLLDTEGGVYIYALNHDGVLYTSSQTGGKHHTYFLKSKPEKSGYGIGKNVACAGHIIAKQGKIIYIDSHSGHYQPIEDQLKIVVQFLHNKGVLDPNVGIRVQLPDYEGGGVKKVSLESILSENAETILKQYPVATKRTHEYIEAQREQEKAFQLSVEQLRPHCPQAFLKKPVTDLFPNFHSPSSKGKVDLGGIMLENRTWKAVLINGWDDLPNSIIHAPSNAFGWGNNVNSTSLVTNIQNGIQTRHAACAYSIQHPQKGFSFYLIPNENNSTEEQQDNSPKMKTSCPTLTPDDIDTAMHMVGAAQYHHIPAGNIAVIQKGDHKYRLKFTSATHVDVPGAKVVIVADLSETTPGNFVCKYVTQNGDGGHNGDFELAFED